MRSPTGLTLLESLFIVAIVSILAAIAIPSYQNYTSKIYYNEVMQATTPYRIAVAECVRTTGKVLGCNAGTERIPPAVTTPKGAIEKLEVLNGVISVTPVRRIGIQSKDKYVLTPTVKSSNTIAWTSSGGGVIASYSE